MRRVVCALFVLGLASPAIAADFDLPPPVPAANFDVLRGAEPVGPATFTRWSGFYVGGQFGYGNANGDFSNATQSLVAYALRDTQLESDVAPSQWQVLGAANTSTVSYGGFAGYNTQWQDLIVGMEANFSRANFSLHAPVSPIARTVSDSSGNAYTVDLTGNGSLVAEDFATLRLRGGWVVGNFLPYGFIGFAMGVGTASVSATVSGVEYTSGNVNTCSSSAPCFPYAYTNSASFNNEVLYGFTTGLGVDFAVTANIFLRAEFEWDQFRSPPGLFASVATGRVGGGLKF
jgi:outer membrane immunogenic protein